MSADKSERSGTRLNTPSIFAESTSNQVGFSLCSANSNDALIVSLGEKARVDIDYMSEISGKSIDDVVKEINVNDGYVLIVPMKGIFDDED